MQTGLSPLFDPDKVSIWEGGYGGGRGLSPHIGDIGGSPPY